MSLPSSPVLNLLLSGLWIEQWQRVLGGYMRTVLLNIKIIRKIIMCNVLLPIYRMLGYQSKKIPKYSHKDPHNVSSDKKVTD
jgi:hypothetical protein